MITPGELSILGQNDMFLCKIVNDFIVNNK